MGPTWDQQDPGRPHVGHVNLAIWDGDDLTPVSAKPSTAIMKITMKKIFLPGFPGYQHFHWPYHGYIAGLKLAIYNLEKSYSTSSINSLWPSDITILWHWTGSTVAQLMTCSQMAPSHYLIQHCLIISEVLWHSSEGSFTGNAQDIYPWYEFDNY